MAMVFRLCQRVLSHWCLSFLNWCRTLSWIIIFWDKVYNS